MIKTSYSSNQNTLIKGLHSQANFLNHEIYHLSKNKTLKSFILLLLKVIFKRPKIKNLRIHEEKWLVRI